MSHRLDNGRLRGGAVSSALGSGTHMAYRIVCDGGEGEKEERTGTSSKAGEMVSRRQAHAQIRG